MPPRQVVISSATADLLNEQVLITGANFTADAEVWLGGFPLTIVSASSTLVIATLPASVKAAPGSYALSIIAGTAPKTKADISLAVGAAGPKGDTGPQGPISIAGMPPQEIKARWDRWVHRVGKASRAEQGPVGPAGPAGTGWPVQGIREFSFHRNRGLHRASGRDTHPCRAVGWPAGPAEMAAAVGPRNVHAHFVCTIASPPGTAPVEEAGPVGTFAA